MYSIHILINWWVPHRSSLCSSEPTFSFFHASIFQKASTCKIYCSIKSLDGITVNQWATIYSCTKIKSTAKWCRYTITSTTEFHVSAGGLLSFDKPWQVKSGVMTFSLKLWSVDMKSKEFETCNRSVPRGRIKVFIDTAVTSKLDVKRKHSLDWILLRERCKIKK